MARTAQNDTLSTRTRRLRLPVRREPHWMRLSKGCHLGYRKLAGGSGTWIAKMRDDATGARHYQALGAADDIRDADGLTVFAFDQVQARARGWFVRKAREIAGVDGAEAAGNATVADAMAAYLAWYRAHRKPSGYVTARAAIETHILPALGGVPLARLTAARIRQWHEELAASAPMVRKARGATGPAYRVAGDDAEAVRKRRATANRVLTVLKAALTRAFADGKVAGDDAWRRVKPFRGADAARVRYLSDDEARRLVNACAPAFRPMVLAALFSGCRYGELCALVAADFNADAGTLLVRTAKGGRPRHVVLTGPAQALFAEQAAGKAAGDVLLPRPDGTPWGRAHQQRPLAVACERASIAPAISFHVLRHTHASRLAMRGVPSAVIAAQLGHSGTRMAERHYAHLAPSYVAATVREAFEDFAPIERGNVAPLRR